MFFLPKYYESLVLCPLLRDRYEVRGVFYYRIRLSYCHYLSDRLSYWEGVSSISGGEFRFGVSQTDCAISIGRAGVFLSSEIFPVYLSKIKIAHQYLVGRIYFI